MISIIYFAGRFIPQEGLRVLSLFDFNFLKWYCVCVQMEGEFTCVFVAGYAFASVCSTILTYL